MIVQIWHQDGDNPWLFRNVDESNVLKALSESELTLVAEIDVKADTIENVLDQAWVATQNFDKPWNSPPCRSSSVGDLFGIGESKWFVSSVGFTKVPRHVQTELPLEVTA